MAKLIRFILLLILSQGLIAQELPDFSANYLVELNSLQAGELKQTLTTNSDGSRIFKSATQAKGIFAFFKPDLVEETSVWHQQEEIIIPQTYLYQRTGGKKDKYMQLHFDWPANRLHINDKKQPWSLELEPKTLDKLVYQFALMSDLADHKTTFNYRIADGGRLKTYTINLLEHEIISTPLGKIETVKLFRQREKKSKRQTTLWCAPALNYLPVKLEHVEKDGAVFTAVLRLLKGINTDNAFSPLRQNKTEIP
ncbi:MAG: DUF3108 domain-containing protein [Methylophagaceae bacterium]